MIRARLEPNARRLLVGQELEGMDSHYDRREQSELLEEYCKAIDCLTINEENKLRREVKELRIKSNEINNVMAKIAELESEIRNQNK
jgi:hypothetical protein